MTYQKALSEGEYKLNGAGLNDAKSEAWILLSYVFKIDRIYYYMHLEDLVNEEKWTQYSEMLNKRITRIPLQYLTGEQEFMGLNFKVNHFVLIPRQDTELLVEEAIKVITPEMRVLDLCTGSGCIAISIAKLAKNEHVCGTDISREALEVAIENNVINETRVKFLLGDMFEQINQYNFNVVVSNPPYISTEIIEKLQPEVNQHEPMLALDGRADGLFFYRRISKEASLYMEDGGYLFLEIGYDQGDCVRRMLEGDHYKEVRILQDLNHKDRLVIARVKKER